MVWFFIKDEVGNLDRRQRFVFLQFENMEGTMFVLIRCRVVASTCSRQRPVRKRVLVAPDADVSRMLEWLIPAADAVFRVSSGSDQTRRHRPMLDDRQDPRLGAGCPQIVVAANVLYSAEITGGPHTFRLVACTLRESDNLSVRLDEAHRHHTKIVSVALPRKRAEEAAEAKKDEEALETSAPKKKKQRTGEEEEQEDTRNRRHDDEDGENTRELFTTPNLTREDAQEVMLLERDLLVCDDEPTLSLLVEIN